MTNIYNQQVDILRDDILEERRSLKLKLRQLKKRRRTTFRILRKDCLRVKNGLQTNVNITRNIISILGGGTNESSIRRGCGIVLDLLVDIFQDQYALLEVRNKSSLGGIRTLKYTLTPFNILRLKKVLGDDLEGNDLEVEESDKQSFGEVLLLESINVFKWKPRKSDKLKSGKIKTSNGGGFFKHTNNTLFDLSRYGVFQSVEKDNYKINCLVRALEHGGLKEDKLKFVKGTIIKREIPMLRLPKIAEMLNVQLVVKKEGSENGKLFYYGKTTDPEIKIGIIDKHYFIIEKVNGLLVDNYTASDREYVTAADDIVTNNLITWI